MKSHPRVGDALYHRGRYVLVVGAYPGGMLVVPVEQAREIPRELWADEATKVSLDEAFESAVKGART